MGSNRQSNQQIKIKPRFGNQSGFTLIQVLVGFGLLGVLSTAAASLYSQMFIQDARMRTKAQLNIIRDKIHMFFIRDRLWESTIAANVIVDPLDGQIDYHFASLANVGISPPGLGPYPFQILNDGGTTYFYDARSPAAGFDFAGNVCNTFNDPDPLLRARCPLRYEFEWRPVCTGVQAPPNCFEPLAEVTARLRYVPVDGVMFNPQGYDFTIVAGSPRIDIVRNCQRLGGFWNATNERCDYNQQYCNDPARPSARLFRGWDLNGNQICEDVIFRGNASGDGGNQFACGPRKVVRGVNPDGSLVCGEPIKGALESSSNEFFCVDPYKVKRVFHDGSVQCELPITSGLPGSSGENTCAAGYKQTGVYRDGTVRCLATIEGANADPGTGRTYCNPGEKVTGIYANGKVSCGAVNDSGGTQSCGAGEYIAEVYPNGSVRCATNPTNSCLPGAVLQTAQGNGTSVCRFLDCPPGETMLGRENGDPVCRFWDSGRVFAEFPGTSIPGGATRYTNFSDVDGRLCNPNVTHAVGGITYTTRFASIVDWTRDVWFPNDARNEPQCQGITGVREAVPGLECRIVTSGRNMTVFPHGTVSTYPSAVQLAVSNNQVDSDTLFVYLEGICSAEYVRTHP